MVGGVRQVHRKLIGLGVRILVSPSAFPDDENVELDWSYVVECESGDADDDNRRERCRVP